MIATTLAGWQLVAVILAALIIGGFLVVLLILREGKSRRVRVGVFVEREQMAVEELEPIPPEDWPTQH
jgi:hypothetical protein